MDVVLDKLENTSITPNGSDNKTSFDVLYKNWGKLGNQEERRKEILEVQKSNRNSKLDKYRGILDLVQAVEENSIFRDYHRAYYRPSIYVAGFNKAPSYSEVLMMSEWMIEKPSDFDTNWVVVPAPKGTRVLLVASNGITRLFTKYGHLLFECRTGLPGGNFSDPKVRTNCCVLDCFYQKKNNTLYVLDILAWNSQPMTDGELEFRDYWMRTQLAELRAIRSINKRNDLNFNLLPKVSCEPESFKSFMMKLQFENDDNSLDGLLFYHKKAQYFSGETPLVGWLFPYMVPEVLGSDITVNPAYMSQKPANYTDQATFITEFNVKMEKKMKPRGQKGRMNSARENQMDTADVSSETKDDESTLKHESNPTNTECMEAEAVSDSPAKEEKEKTVSDAKADETVKSNTTLDKEPETTTTGAMDEEITPDTEKKDISKDETTTTGAMDEEITPDTEKKDISKDETTTAAAMDEETTPDTEKKDISKD